MGCRAHPLREISNPAEEPAVTLGIRSHHSADLRGKASNLCLCTEASPCCASIASVRIEFSRRSGVDNASLRRRTTAGRKAMNRGTAGSGDCFAIYIQVPTPPFLMARSCRPALRRPAPAYGVATSATPDLILKEAKVEYARLAIAFLVRRSLLIDLLCRQTYHSRQWCVLKRRDVLAGASPVRVRAGSPGSRLQPGGEIRLAERSVKDPSRKKGQQISGPQQTVNAEASTDSQPKGVWEGRDAH